MVMKKNPIAKNQPSEPPSIPFFMPKTSGGFGGDVAEIMVKVGETVRRNQLLLTIRPQDAELIEIFSPAIGVITVMPAKYDHVSDGELIAKMSVPIQSFLFSFMVFDIESYSFGCVQDVFVKVGEIVTEDELLLTIKLESGKLIKITSPATGFITALPTENDKVIRGKVIAEMTVQVQNFVLPLVVPVMQCMRGGYVREKIKEEEVVTVNQLLITIEPDDRSGKFVKILSPAAGRITTLMCDIGDHVWSGKAVGWINVQVWDRSSPLLWGYLFTDFSRPKLEAVSQELQRLGYRFVELEEVDDKSLALYVEREEIHTPESLHERNCQLYSFAELHSLDSYAGTVVGPIFER